MHGKGGRMQAAGEAVVLAGAWHSSSICATQQCQGRRLTGTPLRLIAGLYEESHVFLHLGQELPLASSSSPSDVGQKSSVAPIASRYQQYQSKYWQWLNSQYPNTFQSFREYIRARAAHRGLTAKGVMEPGPRGDPERTCRIAAVGDGRSMLWVSQSAGQDTMTAWWASPRKECLVVVCGRCGVS